jgi:L-alanine-DL-glutamate epimerase-like enolase superfamily enzyme
MRMKITDVRTRVFTHSSSKHSDTAGHSHPGAVRKVKNALLTISTDEGVEGHYFAPPELIRPYVVENFFKPVLLGQDPFDRERLWQEMAHWQRGSKGQFSDRSLSIAECALWDLAGRALNLPVYKLIGAYRDKIPAYGSTMCGDELDGGLKTPEDYGNFASQLVARGYQAIKLHTWMPPVSFAPSVDMDIKACAAVRDAVGPDMPLMLDSYHWYSRLDALRLGRGLEKLGFYWLEECMDEQSKASYKWLADQLDIPVIGPETASGKHYTRIEWAMDGACDILRVGIQDVGGIGPALKVIHIAEALGMDCEIHGGNPGNLALCGAMKNGRWFERGLLHPFIDYDAVPEYLHDNFDFMDAEGMVHMPSRPGLGEHINFDYIDRNLV